MSKFYSKAWKSLAKRIHTRDKVCSCCGFSEKLTLHHLIRQRDGGTDSSGNLITICESCHVQVHRSVLSELMFLPCFNARTSRLLALRELMSVGCPEGFTSCHSWIRHVFSMLPPLPEHPSVHQHFVETKRKSEMAQKTFPGPG